MSTEDHIHDCIDTAADTVGSVWPLHSFVTANPLSGFEDQPFGEAVSQATHLLGGRGYPAPETFARALERDQINRDILESTLAEHGYDADPEALLDRMDDATGVDESDSQTVEDRIDTVLTKWLSAFLDEGRAHWPLPDRDAGFYAVFREVAVYDGDIPDEGLATDLPESPGAAIAAALDSQPAEQWVSIFEEQLAALPGWTGFIKQRAADAGEWQTEYPISLAGYLAARLALVDAFDADLEPSVGPAAERKEADELAEAFLSAWEATYRDGLVGTLVDESQTLSETEPSGRPDAQMVFCIDTRSEILRRHIESTGDYETHGYAGFFGIPMEYEGYDAEVSVDACPPIVDPQHYVTDHPTGDQSRERYDRWSGFRDAAAEVIETLEANAATAYGFVESAGSGYGVALATRTLVPSRFYGLLDGIDGRVPDEDEYCSPVVDHQHTYAGDLPVGLTTEQQVEYAATAFDLMGFEEFARLVVFTGHGSQTANNPFDASLDCGACAGNPGGPNARVLAAICNDDTVKRELRDRGFDIPEDTVFIAGEHNTTTDEVELYANEVPESHASDLEQLRDDIETARASATAERAESMGADPDDPVRETERRAADWAETRPEWGLAGNAGFVVGPRELTEDLDLDGRSFLHSYDWTTDPDGEALEAIIAGPMVVTQWINTQYYFATVDNAAFGSGSKVTHNPVGNVGVYQGNGGDLMSGLPLQSLMSADDELYHQPLRLSTVIHAPLDRVTDILEENADVAQLLDNDWLSLTVVDPQQGHQPYHYAGELDWEPIGAQLTETAESTPSPTVADD